MLTADLVHVRRRGEVLSVVPLGEDDRARARELGATYVDLARAYVGCDRASVNEALRAVPVAAHERRLADGLLKLLQDRCVFEEASALEPGPLRAALFSRAAEARRAAAEASAFDRAAVLAAVAAEQSTTPDEIDRALYADLPDAHVLRAVEAEGANALVAAYEAGQVQAVLLRAVKVVAHVHCAAPAAYRTLFRALKFHRLLHQVRANARGYEIEIDGPFSLFESVTKYGLQLALAFPAISACDDWRIEADVRWGKMRRPLSFRASGTHRAADVSSALPDEIQTLLEGLTNASDDWSPRVSDALLDLPGIGVCVPDIELSHTKTGQVVFVEALGHWSRDAVWKRVELVQKGLPVPVVFAVSKHLRVSEAVLDDTLPSALYVYARTPNPRAVLERAIDVAARTTTEKPRKSKR